MKNILQKISLYGIIAGFVLMSFTIVKAQDDNTTIAQDNEKYYPLGNPEDWNVSITPFLWLPAVSGNLVSNGFEKQVNFSSVDILKKLKMAFMMQAEVSKGKFFISPTYFYANLESEKVTRDFNGIPVVTEIPELKINIFELVGGMRFPFSEKFILDAYVGTRFNSYKMYASLEVFDQTTTKEKTVNIWDPTIGFRAHYYPHPRVPILLSADIGGITEGLNLSWTSALTVGYTISPRVDVFLGFNAYGLDYSTYSDFGHPIDINVTMYGLNVGAKILMPKRVLDTTIFKKR